MSNTKKLVSFDWAIKRLLRNKASFGIFEGFLSELLHEDIKIKSLLESESNRETKHDRSNRVDMLVENSKGELIIVEIQRETEYDYLQRILFGASKLLVEYMKKSMPYSKIKKVISISLVYFDLGVGEDYAYHDMTQFIGLNKKGVAPPTHSRSARCRSFGGVISKVCRKNKVSQGISKKDILELNSVQQELYKKEKISDIYPEYYLLKINQFDDIARNTIDEWIYFFKNETIRDDFTAKGLKEASEELDMMKLSEEERREYEAYLESLRYQAGMFESSYKVGEKKGEKKGKEIGLKEGEMKGKCDMAKILKDNGVDIEIIIKSSGLSREEIAKL